MNINYRRAKQTDEEGKEGTREERSIITSVFLSETEEVRNLLN